MSALQPKNPDLGPAAVIPADSLASYRPANLFRHPVRRARDYRNRPRTVRAAHAATNACANC